MFRLFLTLILFSATSAYSQSYEERLERIEEMSVIVPGFISGKYHHRELGAFGGIYVQTEWQLRTGRNNIPAWAHINYFLTTIPSEYFHTWLTDGDDTCSSELPSRVPMCSAWIDYFDYTDVRHHGEHGSTVKQLKSNTLLWKAHKLAIDYALEIRPRLFKEMKTPVEEMHYLTGWIKFVHVLAKSKMPTTEYFIRLLAQPSSPQRSPLGAPHCELSDLPAATRLFVNELIKLGAH